MNTEETLSYWAACMAAEDLSKRTINERKIFFRRLARDLGDLSTITRKDLILWVADQTWANATRSHYRSTLYVFYSWLQDEGLRLDNPAARLPKVKVVRREPTPFTIPEIQRLLDSGIYRKSRMMVILHYYLGLRVSEIARVHGRRDIDWERRTLTTIGKGALKVVLPIPEAAWELIVSMPRDGYWFPNSVANKRFPAGEGHILGNSISNQLAQAIRRAGLTHKPHDLRAATATEMNKEGVSAFVIQKGLRHANMDTTTRYMGLSVEQVKGGFDQLPTVNFPHQSGRRRTPQAA